MLGYHACSAVRGECNSRARGPRIGFPECSIQASSLPDEQTLVRLVVAKRQSTVARFSQVSADGAVFMNRVQLVGHSEVEIC